MIGVSALVVAVALLSGGAVAQTPCVNAANGAVTAKMLTGTTLDGRTSGSASGLIVSSAGMTSWYFLIGGETPQTAAVGTLIHTINSTTIGVSAWDWGGCSNFTVPTAKFGSKVSFAAVGPGTVWAHYGGTEALNGKIVEKWANADGGYMLVDTDTCTSVAIVGELSVRQSGKSVFNWIGAIIVGSEEVSPPPSFYTVPSQCL